MWNGEVTKGLSSWCPNSFFNFGDSLSDTGNRDLTLPDVAHRSPYGESFLGIQAGRACNGRLVIDFILMAFKRPLLRPSASPSHEMDMQGLNFAFGGATATPLDWFVPYSLQQEVEQFIKLKNQVLHTQREQSLVLNKLDEAIYSNAFYIFCIGGNDLIGGLANGLQPKAIIQDIVPSVVYEIVKAIEVLYFQGARKFMVFNGPVLGCSPATLSSLDGLGFPLDDLGCITVVQEMSRALNSELFQSIQRLRASLPNVNITLFDYYAASSEIFSNPSKYRFNPDFAQTICCGSPGEIILNFNITCGFENSNECDNPDEYMSWDGVHWTEAFYRNIAKFILNGEFSDPATNLTKACDLSFDDFGNTTYEEVFHMSFSLSFVK
ncbi:unnamed protein product [Calypogeia fissa]